MTKSLGEQLAEYAAKDVSDDGKDCHVVAYNRLKHIFDKNKKTLPKYDGSNTFTKLWVTNFAASDWKKLTSTYRACGPPGALANEGLATLVTDKQIWEGKLEVGALVQVWGLNKNVDKGAEIFKNLHAGKEGHPDKYYGHSFIFLKYEKKDGKIVGMRIADQATKWEPIVVTNKTFGIFIGGNLT